MEVTKGKKPAGLVLSTLRKEKARPVPAPSAPSVPQFNSKFGKCSLENEFEIILILIDPWQIPANRNQQTIPPSGSSSFSAPFKSKFVLIFIS